MPAREFYEGTLLAHQMLGGPHVKSYPFGVFPTQACDVVSRT